MPKSVAVVSTDASVRYAKQLLAHLGRKDTVERVPGVPDGGVLVFAYGTGAVLPEPDRLVLRAEAVDSESLQRVQDVLARHLERFGKRRELTVRWADEDEVLV